MEFGIAMLVLFVIYSIYEELKTKEDTTDTSSTIYDYNSSYTESTKNIILDDPIVGTVHSKRKKKFKKSRENESHTYDKWLELGYQVRKGEKYAYKFYGKYMFTRDQVAKL